ncbi:MAG: 4'-phosphopantetheinyl transferase superfamily protein [Deltaproteobacteria bacterium]|jgi:phosphopantetheinyl transferase (holo-ACP synthase)|nr:4'-phosphopantetheinyl transferase superfamily protein [Deltaproteobacteria bacterium]
MDFQLKKCIVADHRLQAGVISKQLQYPHLLTCTLLDLPMLEEEMNRQGEEKVVAYCLAGEEVDRVGKFTFPKRKREWLGGRFAAKYAAAGLAERAGSGEKPPHWSEYIITTDENGRPFLAGDKGESTKPVPDISISHSESMAAAMAVYPGYCGIDIQKITPQVLRVRERFCIDGEKQLLDKFFPVGPDREAVVLAKLWAAKEALRKASCLSSLPGFMELQLIEININSESDFSVFVFSWLNPARGAPGQIRAAVTLSGDYALALTVRDDTVR